MKARKSLMSTPDGPKRIYDEIKQRHYRFLETSTERQLRVRGDWTALENTKNMSNNVWIMGGSPCFLFMPIGTIVQGQWNNNYLYTTNYSLINLIYHNNNTVK